MADKARLAQTREVEARLAHLRAVEASPAQLSGIEARPAPLRGLEDRPLPLRGTGTCLEQLRQNGGRPAQLQGIETRFAPPRQVTERAVGHDLPAARRGSLRDGAEPVPDARNLQAGRRRPEDRQLANGLGRNIAHCHQHAHGAVPVLCQPPPGEHLRATIRREPSMAPRTIDFLDTQLAIESTRQEPRVERPVIPG